nr:tRNA pseudouridine(55) synthase TruB [Sedimentibacter sp.]
MANLNNTKNTNNINGILNILKPTGMTSHDVVSCVRKILNTKHVGHAGTLDPNVAGVLVICVGKGTKFSEILMNGDKEYICELVLGKKTDTQDSYGKIIEERSIPDLSEQQIRDVLKKFEGEQLQIPPAYSAVKLNGKKLYEYARENIIVKKPGKTVNIKEIKLIKFECDKILMKVTCTKGTYMRTLCNDIGEYIGTFGHMGVLIRTDAKGLKIEDAISLDELKFLYDNNRLNECLIPVDKIFAMEKVFIDDKYYDKLLTGNEIAYDTSDLSSNEFFIYCRNMLIGLGHKTKENQVKINKMLM